VTVVGCVCGVWWGWGREMRKRIFFNSSFSASKLFRLVG